MSSGGERAEIGVIGGSGLYSLLEGARPVRVETPYGDPSDEIAIGEVGGRSVAFIPRHGRRHSLPPAAINYRANLWALHRLGVRQVVAPCAVGSLRPEIKPGDLVVCDQFVDRTSGRADTFHESGPTVVHVSTAEPYCPVMRGLAVPAARKMGIPVHDGGTVVVVQGPRFSTKAESRWFGQMGWHLVNMTQYPEVTLARELEMCYLNLSLVTDYDAGLEGDPAVKPVSVAEVEESFGRSMAKVRSLVIELIPRLPAKRRCECATALRGAVLGG